MLYSHYFFSVPKHPQSGSDISLKSSPSQTEVMAANSSVLPTCIQVAVSGRRASSYHWSIGRRRSRGGRRNSHPVYMEDRQGCRCRSRRRGRGSGSCRGFCVGPFRFSALGILSIGFCVEGHLLLGCHKQTWCSRVCSTNTFVTD